MAIGPVWDQETVGSNPATRTKASEIIDFRGLVFSADICYLPRFRTSSSMRFFQSALSGLLARTLHTASLMTS